MASTYALPVNPAPQSHSHGHSRSQFLSDRPPPWNGQVNGASPVKKGHTNGHIHHHSELNGQLPSPGLSPYADLHEHTHDHSRSVDSSFSLKPLMGGRPRGRPRGESDLGRPPTRKSNTAGKFGFSPIQEVPAPPSTSWLELPEALAALLIPLPYLFASLAYPSVVAQTRNYTSGTSSSHDQLLDTALGDSDTLSSQILPNSSQLLHACTLSLATLILVGIISKIRSLNQPLDRRKSFGNSEASGNTLGGILNIQSLWRIGSNILSILLPYYAAMQLGGARAALVLLTAIATGIGSFDHHRPGKKSSLWDACRRSIRTRRATCGVILLGLLWDVFDSSTSPSGAMLGHLALVASVLAIPPPLPTTGWSLVVKSSGSDEPWNTQTAARASLPKPSSPLVNTPEDTLLTIAAGVLLTFLTIFFSIVSSPSPSIAHHAILFSTLSVASATALIFFSLPSSLRSQKKSGVALGCFLITAFGVLQPPATSIGYLYIPALCVLSFAAIIFDTTSSISQTHTHSEHSGHKHAHLHSQSEHHLHGHHSKLSVFLIELCEPGSIVHSILIEKDSRRIFYFAILNLGFMLIQFFYGYVSGSLGLLTDSIHMLFDCAGLAVGLAAAVMSKWPPNARFPYGYGKVDTLSGFANGIFLMLVSVEIVFDAFERLWEGHELQRLNELLIVSVLGFLVNIVGLTAFGHAHHGHSHDHGEGEHCHDNENMQGIFLHILADALGSVAVIISTLLTKYYGWSGWDPIASCIIAVLIFVSAIPLVKSSGLRLLLSLPADIEYGVRNTLQELSSLRGVVGYAVPRFWLEDAGAAHAEVHKHDDHSHSSHTHSKEDCGGKGDHHHHHHHGSDSSQDSPHSHHSHHHHHHGPEPGKQKVLGVIHVIASQAADLEDVRERTAQFLKGRNLDVVLHVEREGEGRCWCGGGNKTS
ncbi:hypothetical protein K469DRAFT_615891 [Zopfia rhizophila CBS 207.26]|uniref:Zinc transporter n=1 Tax=Zopfia rhizophila CBS 207.26 TaxID=1314779 RepID=A0A6A6EWG3_9PEZI|nr:hypothetical protein K469DRAFT_615891 [Zopfia rhizophila CBS 207.26]